MKYKSRKRTSKMLMDTEKRIFDLWNSGTVPYYVHLSGGNENNLINIFENIEPEDYVFSTHRNHYHYLLKGGTPEQLEKEVIKGNSMHLCDKSLNFISTAIVGGGPAMATGTALGLKLKKEKGHVWCFVGDGAEDEGHFYEAVRYVQGKNLPCTFIIEDNNRSVETPKEERYGNYEIKWPSCVKRYHYIPTYPHAGTGKFVAFGDTVLGSTM